MEQFYNLLTYIIIWLYCITYALVGYSILFLSRAKKAGGLDIYSKSRSNYITLASEHNILYWSRKLLIYSQNFFIFYIATRFYNYKLFTWDAGYWMITILAILGPILGTIQKRLIRTSGKYNS